MSTLDELRTYLNAQSVATHFGLGSRPDQPDDVLTLTEMPGLAPIMVHNQALPILEQPAIQVVARSDDYVTASTMIRKAWAALVALTNTTLSGTRYVSVRPTSAPSNMGRDANARYLLGFSVQLVKETSP